MPWERRVGGWLSLILSLRLFMSSYTRVWSLFVDVGPSMEEDGRKEEVVLLYGWLSKERTDAKERLYIAPEYRSVILNTRSDFTQPVNKRIKTRSVCVMVLYHGQIQGCERTIKDDRSFDNALACRCYQRC